MGDLTDLQAAQQIKVIGQDSTGLETTPVKSTTGGAIHTNIRDNAGNEKGISNAPFFVYQDYDNEFLTSFLSAKTANLLAPSTANFYFQTITAKVAIRKFNVGGHGACEGTLSRYYPTDQSFVSGDAFNSIANVALWTNTGLSSSGPPLAWAYATDQFIEGTGSAKLTFTKSTASDQPEITYTFSTPFDASLWKSINAKVRVTVAAGGATSRTVSVRLTSGTAVRIYQIVGTTTTAPFATEQWSTILADISTPDATAGSGTFDPSSINSISLRLVDGASKTGSIWWDDVRFIGRLSPISKIYTAGTTVEDVFDPTIVFNIGDSLALTLKNNSLTTDEFRIAAMGILI